LTLEIRDTTDSGLPSDTTLISVTISGADLPDEGLDPLAFTEFDLADPVLLKEGQLYAIVVSTEAPGGMGPYWWSGSTARGGVYAGGKMYVSIEGGPWMEPDFRDPEIRGTLGFRVEGSPAPEQGD
jgi:hypothetical protein